MKPVRYEILSVLTEKEVERKSSDEDRRVLVQMVCRCFGDPAHLVNTLLNPVYWDRIKKQGFFYVKK